MNEYEQQQKEKEKKEMELKELNQKNFQNPIFDDDDEFSSEHNISIIIQEKNKKEVKVLIIM